MTSGRRQVAGSGRSRAASTRPASPAAPVSLAAIPRLVRSSAAAAAASSEMAQKAVTRPSGTASPPATRRPRSTPSSLMGAVRGPWSRFPRRRSRMRKRRLAARRRRPRRRAGRNGSGPLSPTRRRRLARTRRPARRRAARRARGRSSSTRRSPGAGCACSHPMRYLTARSSGRPRRLAGPPRSPRRRSCQPRSQRCRPRPRSRRPDPGESLSEPGCGTRTRTSLRCARRRGHGCPHWRSHGASAARPQASATVVAAATSARRDRCRSAPPGFAASPTTRQGS
jgi:hypothetical protein